MNVRLTDGGRTLAGLMRPYFMLIAVVIIYAGNILVGKALTDLPPVTIAVLRLTIAWVCIAPLAARSAWQAREVFWRHRAPLLLLSLTGVTFFSTFIYAALQFTSPTNVSVLETLIPAATIVLSAYVFRERLRGLQWSGLALSMFGALWVITDGRVTVLAQAGWNVGDGIMVGAIISWAVYSVALKRSMHLFPTYGVLFVMTGLSTLILVPLAAVEWALLGVPTFRLAEHLPGLLYLGIFPSLIALVLYNRAVLHLGPSQASIFLNFLPVATMAGAVLWFDEVLSVAKVSGAVLVILGVLLVTQAGRPRTLR